MALYLIAGRLVSARNGHHAKEITGCPLNPRRVTEAEPHGIVSDIESDVPAPDAPREADVTGLSDRGVRRFRNLDTGEEREEPR